MTSLSSRVGSSFDRVSPSHLYISVTSALPWRNNEIAQIASRNVINRTLEGSEKEGSRFV